MSLESKMLYWQISQQTLDLDWEYPGSREGSRQSDKELFSRLVSVKNLTELQEYCAWLN